MTVLHFLFPKRKKEKKGGREKGRGEGRGGREGGRRKPYLVYVCIKVLLLELDSLSVLNKILSLNIIVASIYDLAVTVTVTGSF